MQHGAGKVGDLRSERLCPAARFGHEPAVGIRGRVDPQAALESAFDGDLTFGGRSPATTLPEPSG